MIRIINDTDLKKITNLVNQKRTIRNSSVYNGKQMSDALDTIFVIIDGSKSK